MSDCRRQPRGSGHSRRRQRTSFRLSRQGGRQATFTCSTPGCAHSAGCPGPVSQLCHPADASHAESQLPVMHINSQEQEGRQAFWVLECADAIQALCCTLTFNKTKHVYIIFFSRHARTTHTRVAIQARQALHHCFCHPADACKAEFCARFPTTSQGHRSS